MRHLLFLVLFLSACVTTVSAEQRGAFEAHYEEAIMSSMFVGICVSRHGDTPDEAAQTQTDRMGRIMQRAEALGLSDEMQRAEAAHSRRMATIRIATHCPNGVEAAAEALAVNLDSIERALR